MPWTDDLSNWWMRATGQEGQQQNMADIQAQQQADRAAHPEENDWDYFWNNAARQGRRGAQPLQNTNQQMPVQADPNAGLYGGGASDPYSQYNSQLADQQRQNQMEQIQRLQRQAQGDPESRAQKSLMAANKSAQDQQLSIASSLRGQTAGAALSSAREGAQNIERGLGNDQRMLYVQEQQDAQGRLGNALNQLRQQDLQQYQDRSNFAANEQQLRDQQNQFGLAGGINQAQWWSQQQRDQERVNQGLQAQSQANQDAFNQQLIGAAGGAAGTLGSIGRRAASRDPNTEKTDDIDPRRQWKNPYGGY
jgi:hypothetical protein